MGVVDKDEWIDRFVWESICYLLDYFYKLENVFYKMGKFDLKMDGLNKGFKMMFWNVFIILEVIFSFWFLIFF